VHGCAHIKSEDGGAARKSQAAVLAR
jgi:hypothetical protein